MTTPWVSTTDPYMIELWPDAPSEATTELLLAAAQEQCEQYAPTPVPDPVPARYKQACVLQARATWRSTQAGPGDNLGGDGFTVTAYPMDKTIRSLLRPVHAVRTIK